MPEEPIDDEQAEDTTEHSYAEDALGIPELAGPPEGQRRTGDPVDEVMPPAERPRAADAFGTTADEQRRGPGLDLRLSEEVEDDEVPVTDEW